MAPQEPPVIRLHILGAFRVEREGAAEAEPSWRLRSARTLVKVLAANPSHAIHREALQDALWPHFEAGAAYNSFRKALHLARHGLEPELKSREPSRYLLVADDVVSLNVANVWIDADQFEFEARWAIEHSDLARAERALALYGGDLLAEDPYVEWAAVRRDELLRLRLLLLSSVAEALERQGAYVAAGDRLYQILSVDPLHEGAHHALMRIYVRGGNRLNAIKQYGVYADLLQKELGVEPDAETQALYRTIVAGESNLSSPGSSKSNASTPTLPVQVDRMRSGPLIGRAETIEVLIEHLESALAGRGGLTFLGGEAGIGKSRLMAELAYEAHARGGIVLWGTSYADEGLLPYGALAEALDGAIVSWPEDEKRALATEFPEVAALLSVLPSGSVAAHDPAFGVDERTRLFSAIVRALTDLSQGLPLLIVLDDLQWADEGSLQLLHYIARSLQSRSWLIVAGYREEDVTPDGVVRTLIRATEREGLSYHVGLPRLSRDDAGHFAHSLLGGSVDQHLVRKLYTLSLGNPLFLQQLLMSMRESDRVECLGDIWTENGHGEAVIPRKVQELIDLRLARLDGDTRQALSLAAVIGMDSSVALLGAASHLDEMRLLHALDVATAARFLDETTDGYTFRHPLFREVLSTLPSQARRAAMHRAVGDALESLEPNEVERLAYHFAHGDDRDRARHYYETAGDRADAMHAPEVALSHYRDALDHCDETVHRADVGRLMYKMAEVQVTGGRYDDALDLLERVATLHGRDDAGSEALGAVTARIGYVHAMRGTPTQGADRVRSLLAAWDHGESSTKAALLLQLARIEGVGDRYTECLSAAERASDLAAAVGDVVTHTEAESLKGNALMMLGRVDDATRVLKEAVARAQADGAEMNLIDLEGRLGVLTMMEGAIDESARYAWSAVVRAEKLGDPVRTAVWRALLALGAIVRGEWSDARRHLDRCVALNTEIGDHQLTAYPLSVLGRLLVAEGDWRTAHQVFEHARTNAEASNNLQARRLTAWPLGELHILEGHPEQALALLTPLLDRPGLLEGEATLLLSWVASAYRDLGRAQDAMETIDQAISRARQQRGNVCLCEAFTVRAGLLAAEGRYDEADAEFSAAHALAREIRYPLAEGRALAAWGTVLAERGHSERAIGYLQEARSIYVRLGARRFEASVRDELRRVAQDEPAREQFSA